MKERVSHAFTHTRKQGWGVYGVACIFFSLSDTPCVWAIVWLQVLINKSWHSIETSYSPAAQDDKPTGSNSLRWYMCHLLGLHHGKGGSLLFVGNAWPHSGVYLSSPSHHIAKWHRQLEAEKWELAAFREGRSGTICAESKVWSRGQLFGGEKRSWS